MRMKAIFTALALMLAISNASATDPLASRVAPPPQIAIEQFAQAGMRDVRPHDLTPTERSRVEAALASLPSAHRTVLEKRLSRLSFVDGMPGQGTGLTSPSADTGQFDITLRASLINESLSTFLTNKERRLFEADGSGRSIAIEASGTDALTYVLLHEATHVLDSSLAITADLDSPFVGSIWVARRELIPALAGSAAATTTFRGGRKIPISEADTIYDALAKTPFVSLYATASASEDLAELIAWNEVLQRFHGTLVISINDSDGKPVKRYELLSFPAVKARMARVDELLKRTVSDCALPRS